MVKNPALFGQNQALFGQNLGLAGSGEKPAARKQDKNIWLAESLAETPAGRKQDKIRWAPQIRAVAAWADSSQASYKATLRTLPVQDTTPSST